MPGCECGGGGGGWLSAVSLVGAGGAVSAGRLTSSG